MLPKVGDGLQMDWSMLRVGYRLGMCAVLAVWVCWDCIWQVMVSDNQSIGEGESSERGRTAVPSQLVPAVGGLDSFGTRLVSIAFSPRFLTS